MFTDPLWLDQIVRDRREQREREASAQRLSRQSSRHTRKSSPMATIGVDRDRESISPRRCAA